MNRKELTAAVAKSTGQSLAEAGKAVAAVFDVIGKNLAKGNGIRLVGFGSFDVVKRPARKGRNPRTGETLKVPAYKAVKFKAGRPLKDGVNKR